jgi:hypothetical protein
MAMDFLLMVHEEMRQISPPNPMQGHLLLVITVNFQEREREIKEERAGVN